MCTRLERTCEPTSIPRASISAFEQCRRTAWCNIEARDACIWDKPHAQSLELAAAAVAHRRLRSGRHRQCARFQRNVVPGPRKLPSVRTHVSLTRLRRIALAQRTLGADRRVTQSTADGGPRVRRFVQNGAALHTEHDARRHRACATSCTCAGERKQATSTASAARRPSLASP